MPFAVVAPGTVSGWVPASVVITIVDEAGSELVEAVVADYLTLHLRRPGLVRK